MPNDAIDSYYLETMRIYRKDTFVNGCFNLKNGASQYLLKKCLPFVLDCQFPLSLQGPLFFSPSLFELENFFIDNYQL